MDANAPKKAVNFRIKLPKNPQMKAAKPTFPLDQTFLEAAIATALLSGQIG
jgi:hypothetical protein